MGMVLIVAIENLFKPNKKGLMRDVREHMACLIMKIQQFAIDFTHVITELLTRCHAHSPLFLMLHLELVHVLNKRLKTAKVCGEDVGGGQLKTVEGFTCPGKEQIGPQGLLQAHPIFPHPHDCQFFFTCFFGKDPNKFGCPKVEVFNAESLTCKDPVEVPDCACWYDCGEDSRCPETCNADCSCGSQGGAVDES